MRRLTVEEFVKRAREIHRNKYGYDKVEYKNMKTNVLIFCKKCNDYFEQTPEHHLLQKCGCPTCEMVSRAGRPLYKKRRLVKGVGILDVDFSHTKDEDTRHVYEVWMNILQRCYKNSSSKKHKSYEGCYVCEKWKHFSNFLAWWKDNYVEGCVIDKDIIKRGNKCYCQEYCVFVPVRINDMFGYHKRGRGECPIGVHKARNGRFSARISKMGTRINLGTFKTKEEAFFVYKHEKEKYVKEVSDDYYNRGLITKRVHEALYKWTIEIND